MSDPYATIYYTLREESMAKNPKNGRNMIRVSQIDTEKAGAFFTERARATGDNDTVVQGEPFAVVSTPKGIATVCSEGVGWWANNVDKYLLGGFIGSYGEPTYYVTGEELASLISDEMIEFSEFVNTFGDRLEVNYSLWYDEIRGCFQEPNVIREKCQTPVLA